MADNITNLQNAFSYITKFGLAFPNRYFVTFDRPPAGLVVPGALDDNQARLRINCESVDFPSKNIAVDDYKIGKHIRKNAFGYNVDPVRATFRCSGDMMEKVFFDKWQELICNPYTGQMEYHDNFICDVRIEVLDHKNEVVYGIKLIEAYPQNVSAGQLSFATTNDVIKVDVTFAYTRYEIIDVGIAEQTSDLQIQKGLASLTNFDLNFQNLVGNQTSPIGLIMKSASNTVLSQLAPLVELKNQTKQTLDAIGNLNPASEAQNWFDKISAVASRDWDITDPAQTINILGDMKNELIELEADPSGVGMVAQEVTALKEQIDGTVARLSPLINRSEQA